jgi:outer membrane protein
MHVGSTIIISPEKFRTMSRPRCASALVAAFCASILSACASGASWTNPLDRLVAPAVAPATSTSPSTPWLPPASAVPPAVKVAPPEYPAGVHDSSTIPLAQIIDTALANNPATRVAWLQARAAEAALGSSRAAYFPEVDLGASLIRTNGVVATSAQTRLAPSLSLSYLLFDFGGRDATVEQARQTLIAADYLHNQAIQDLILRAQQTYYDYLDAKALLSAQVATIKERQTGLDVADGRHSAGVATIGDVLQARTALSQARLALESIEGNLHTLEGALANVMGLSTQTHFEFGELPAEVPATPVLQHVDELIARAAEARPELAAQRAVAERAQARVRAVQAQGLPTISLDGSAGASIGIGNGGGATHPYSAGISLTVPLFTGGRNTYDLREARLGVDIATENFRDVKQQIDLQVWTSYYGLQTATRRVATTRDLLSDARQAVDVESGRYKAGVGTIIDVLTAQAALENARAQEVQARADWYLAVAQLAHDTGTLEPMNEVAK